MEELNVFSVPLPYDLTHIHRLAEINKEIKRSSIKYLYGCLPLNAKDRCEFEQSRVFDKRVSSLKTLLPYIEFAKDRKIKLVFGTFIVDCSSDLDPMTEGMLKMMGVFSEIERNIISQRVKSGMDNAKAKGKTIGRRKTTIADIPNVFLKHYDKYKKGELSKMDLSRLCDISYPTVYKYIGILEG